MKSTRSPHRFLLHCGSLCAAVLLAFTAIGCRSSEEYSDHDRYYYANQAERIDVAYAEAVDDTGPDALLGVAKLLSSAITQGDWVRAEELAILASTLCNIHVGYDEGERDALSLLGQEKAKPFKGEPHEQVMVDFYLGLLRYQKGDFEGALSAFRSAIYKDRGSYFLAMDPEKEFGEENRQRYLYTDDYVLLRLLAAKCYHLLGEPEEAERNLGIAKRIAPEIAPLLDEAFYPENNVLVIIEGGRTPIKRKSGPQGSVLAYEHTWGPRLHAIEIDGGGLSFSLADDLYHQATTLGPRAVDELNEEKAATQSAIHAVGLYSTIAGVILAQSGNSDVQLAGLGVLAAGIAAMIFASAIAPSADTRSWSLLPRYLYLGVGGAHTTDNALLSIRASGPGGSESQTWTDVPVREDANLYWIRLLPGKSGGVWPRPRPERPPEEPLPASAPPILSDVERTTDEPTRNSTND